MAMALLRSPLLCGACSAESGARILPSPCGGQGSLKGTVSWPPPVCAVGTSAWGSEVGGRDAVWLLSDLFTPHPHPAAPLHGNVKCASSPAPKRDLAGKQSPRLLEKRRGGGRIRVNLS
jgi:hypothetical protein